MINLRKFRDDFCLFILSHGRPNNIITLNTLNRIGYDGDWYIIIDNEDDKADDYYKKYGDKVIMFDKLAISKTFDEMDNFDNRKTIVYARNYCFELAKKLNKTYFMELDDDYHSFDYKFTNQGKFKHVTIRKGTANHLEHIINEMINYYEKDKRILALAMAQGGDFIGGEESQLGNSITMKRKAMNTILCSTKRPFIFMGRINEDVNTYVRLGQIGYLMFTIGLISIKQKQTQKTSGGMTEIYLENGTYVKSFYTIMLSPSSVKISKMGVKEKRIHHKINWNHTVPKIISEEHKKLF